MNPGHQPERFEVYKQLEDGTGFTIADCSHIFLYDRYGGWCDQFGNYYNERGEADDPPSSSESHSHSASQSESYSSRGSSEDPYEAQFGVPRDLSDDQEENKQDSATIAKNLCNLHSYPDSQLLRVHFRNLPAKTRKEELLKAYNAHSDGGILNAIIETDQQGKSLGMGYFIAKPLFAQKIVKLEGKRLLEQPLTFEVEDYENFLVFPVEQRELSHKPIEQSKKYVLKNPPKPQQVQEQKQVKWRWYKFEKDIFPKKTSFRNWMTDNGFNAEEDYRNIEKIENDLEKRFAKVEMKESVFSVVNGLMNGERPVEFLPI